MGNKLYVGNLSFRVTSEDLQDHFSAAGEVRSAIVLYDRETGRSRGFGFVEMGSDDEAARLPKDCCVRAFKAPTNTDTIGFAGVHARMARQVALAHSGHGADREALKRPERFGMGDAHAPAASVAINVAIPLRPALSGLPRRQTPCLGDHFYDWPAHMPMAASANPECAWHPRDGAARTHPPAGHYGGQHGAPPCVTSTRAPSSCAPCRFKPAGEDSS